MDQNTQGQTTTDMTFGKVTCYAPKTVRSAGVFLGDGQELSFGYV